MSKKRKTRKQKEVAIKRHAEQIHVHIESPIYSIAQKHKTIAPEKQVSQPIMATPKNADFSYLRKDMISISAAGGIILAFDALLFILLVSGTLKLGFLGY